MLRSNSSLESLLQTATNPENSGPDIQSIENFAGRVNTEPDGARSAARLLASRIQSTHEWESLQALHVLEYCMKICEESGFVAEVSKFRFLNEMIKLVSPKYLGSRTPASVKTRVIEILFTWTQRFPAETKIQEAYDMLRKQGVITIDHVPSQCEIVPPRLPDKTSVFEDDEKAKLLRRLLQSKHPDDLQAANRLIKNMVREDEKRSERQSKVTSTLEQVRNNCQLLTEMLVHYDKSKTSRADVELMAELRLACEQLRPSLSRVAEECEEQDMVLSDVLQAGDDLTKLLENYDTVIVRGEKMPVNRDPTSLLDLTSSCEDSFLPTASTTENFNMVSDVDQLREVFSSATVEDKAPPLSNQMLPDPLTPFSPMPTLANNLPMTGVSLAGGIGCVQNNFERSSFTQKNCKKSSLNDPLKSLDLDLLVQSKLSEGLKKTNESLSDDSLLSDIKTSSGDESLLDVSSENVENHCEEEKHEDKALLDISDTVMNKSEQASSCLEKTSVPKDNAKVLDCKALLTDLNVTLESIKPSSCPPITVLSQPDGISVTLHVAQNSPRSGVYVVVISIQSKLSQPIASLLFQAVIPDKSCKLRLQPPSVTELATFNPFLPPPTATQLLLIANPQNVPVALKFMLSYSVDGDMVTELGEVDNLPLDCKATVI